jgi:hypothetical protein
MKKSLIAIAMLAAATMSSPATLILNEPFDYPDGLIINVSSGLWITHSGTTGQVDVVSGKVNVSQSESEDVSRLLPGAPYSGVTNLYASFVINVSTLPSGSGSYFWHYRDQGTTLFRARVFLSTTNAGTAPGKFRVGVANAGNTPVYIPTDLDLNTDIKLVVRLVNGTNTTLWINPPSESSMANRADATDVPTGAWTNYFVCLRQASGVGILTVDNLLIGTQFTDVQTPGGPPSISGLVNVSIPANTNTGPMPFVITDVETPASNLVLTAISDNPTLVPNNPANLTFGGSGENRTLTVTPALNQQGVANIQVIVTDTDSNSATNAFTLTVGAPTISTIPNQVALVGVPVGPIAFTVNDFETPPGNLTVTATSSDQTVLPDANIGIQNLGGQNRAISLTNAAAGVATVTVTVSDGTFNIPTTFTLTASPDVGVVLADDFSYPDGSVVTNSSSFWSTHSGTPGQMQVLGGRLILDAANTEDVNAFLTNYPYAASGGYVFYARFIVNYATLPTASGVGEYFAHFKSFTTDFRARVFATTNGAAPGTYRLGIANGGFVTTVFPQDLQTNRDYVVITRYNVATANDSALWVDPVSESSPHVTASDLSSPVTIYSYAFRENTGIGALKVDDLKIASTFSAVLTNLAPSPVPLQITRVGNDVVLSWSNPLFKLQAAPAVTGTYTNVPGALNTGYTNPITGSQKFFRLVYP